MTRDNRCSWVKPSNPLYVAYHDQEWGRPLHDDHRLFELLCLETYQAGLSWETVLNKRSAFSSAFHGYAVAKVAQMTDQELDSSNITYLTKFPKVGKKTAQQMVLDLAGKFEPQASSADANGRAGKAPISENIALEEAMEALLALGYKATELKKIKTFFDGTTDTAENYIKGALKMLMK